MPSKIFGMTPNVGTNMYTNEKMAKENLKLSLKWNGEELKNCNKEIRLGCKI